MEIFYVFLNIEFKGEQSTLGELKKIKEVKKAQLVHGLYDIVVRLEASTTQQLREALSEKIKKIPQVKNAFYLVVVNQA